MMCVAHTNVWLLSADGDAFSAKLGNSTTRTPTTDIMDMLYNTINGHHQYGRAHNNSTTSCTTNSLPTDKNLSRPNILTCRDVALALRFGKFVVQHVVELLWACPLCSEISCNVKWNVYLAMEIPDCVSFISGQNNDDRVWSCEPNVFLA